MRSAFARAIHFNMDAEDLSSLMMSYARKAELTYDNNLTTLAMRMRQTPSRLRFSLRDFEAKERVLDHIDAYQQSRSKPLATMIGQFRTPTTWASSWAR